MNFYPMILAQETKQTNKQDNLLILTVSREIYLKEKQKKTKQKQKQKNNNGSKKSVNLKITKLIATLIVLRLLVIERRVMRKTEVVMRIMAIIVIVIMT